MQWRLVFEEYKHVYLQKDMWELDLVNLWFIHPLDARHKRFEEGEMMGLSCLSGFFYKGACISVLKNIYSTLAEAWEQMVLSEYYNILMLEFKFCQFSQILMKGVYLW